jgi:hypothetical protein
VTYDQGHMVAQLHVPAGTLLEIRGLDSETAVYSYNRKLT